MTISDEEILRDMRRRLAAGEFAERRLPTERDLAEAYGVGRRIVRRALDLLAADGLIWRRQGQGTFASPPPLTADRELMRLSSRTSPLEVIEARLAIEPVLAHRSAVRATRTDIDALRRAADRAAAARDARDYEAWDSAFHRKIAECSGNILFLAIFDMVIRVRHEADWETVRNKFFSERRVEELAAEHDLIVKSIDQRDPAAAEATMRTHLRDVLSRLIEPQQVETIAMGQFR